MALTPEKYQKLQALLSDPNKEFPDDERERAQAAVDAYRNDFRERAQGPLSAEMPGAYDPSKTQQVASGISQASDQGAEALLAQLDPNISLPAQALALSPATTHPGGDEAAKDEWVRGDLNNPNGVVVAYEMPVRKAREKLLENPELFRALQLDVPQTPEGVMGIQEGDSAHQLLNDYYFREAADKAAEAGKTIYRRAKAPWLGDGQNASRLDTLTTKLSSTPLGGTQAFILGVDDSAFFGANRATSDAASLGFGGTLSPEDDAKLRKDIPEYGKQDPTKKQAALVSGRESVQLGGEDAPASNQERNDNLEADNPLAFGAGQVFGAASGAIAGAARGAASLGKKALNAVRGETATVATMPSKGPQWNLADELWNRITQSGPAPKSLIGGAASGVARQGAAGAAEQTAREGVQAASNYVETGDTGTTLGDAAGRVAGAAAAPAALGMLGGATRGLSNQLVEGVEWGSRYGGAPGRVKAHGVETAVGKGHVPPEAVKQAERRGRAEGGRTPLTVLASDLDEPLADAVNHRASEAERVAQERTAAHFESPEGGHTLPMRNTVEEAASQLRKLHSEVPRHGQVPVARGRVQGPLVDIFNANIEGVSARPTKNGVKLSAKEARAFLAENWTKKLNLDKLEEAGKPVYVTPRRYDSVGAEEFIAELRKSKDPHVVAVHDAAINDRGARGGGGWAKEKGDIDRKVADAKATTERVGSTKPGGVRDTVIAVGKGKGQHEATPALRDAARAAGGDAPEKLRGALVADDLEDLHNWSSLGGRNPLASPWSLWGLTDKAVLKGAYPMARNLEKLPVGGAKTAGRTSAVATRNAMDGPADERREKRDAKNAEGYRERAQGAGAGGRKRSKRKLVRRRRTQSSEAQQ